LELFDFLSLGLTHRDRVPALIKQLFGVIALVAGGVEPNALKEPSAIAYSLSDGVALRIFVSLSSSREGQAHDRAAIQCTGLLPRTQRRRI
jgi:hypothetical protein